MHIFQAFLLWLWLWLWVSQKLKDMALSTSKSSLSLPFFGLSSFLCIYSAKLFILAQALIFFLLLFSSCWLSLEGGLLYSFVGPAAAVVLVHILPFQPIIIRCLFYKIIPHYYPLSSMFFSLANR